MKMNLPLSMDLIDELVRDALLEDVGPGDLTTLATVPAESRKEAQIVAKAAGVIAGLAVAERVFHRLDPHVEFRPVVDDGESVRSGQPIVRIAGRAQPILTGERVALNFLQHLSGIATRTASF